MGTWDDESGRGPARDGGDGGRGDGYGGGAGDGGAGPAAGGAASPGYWYGTVPQQDWDAGGGYGDAATAAYPAPGAEGYGGYGGYGGGDAPGGGYGPAGPGPSGGGSGRGRSGVAPAAVAAGAAAILVLVAAGAWAVARSGDAGDAGPAAAATSTTVEIRTETATETATTTMTTATTTSSAAASGYPEIAADAVVYDAGDGGVLCRGSAASGYLTCQNLESSWSGDNMVTFDLGARLGDSGNGDYDVANTSSRTLSDGVKYSYNGIVVQGKGGTLYFSSPRHGTRGEITADRWRILAAD